MKPGYSFIEITVGIFLSSLLAMALFQSVRSTTSTVKLADDLMDLDIRVATFHHQFERDTLGIFVPEFTVPPAQAQEQPPMLGQPPALAAKTDTLQQEQKQPKTPDKLFYSVNNEQGMVREFTFITTNPIAVYQKANNVTKSPRMVRVMYRLIQDPKHEDMFTLFRQESPELEASMLDAKADKPVRAYALLGNIKNIKIEFAYPVKREQAPAQKPAQAIGQKPEAQKETPAQDLPEIEKIERRADWPFKTPQEAKEKQVPPSAQLVIVTFQLWDEAHSATREFELQYPVMSFTLAPKKQKKRKPVAPQKPNPQEPGAPGQKGAPGVPAQNGRTGRRLEATVALKPSTQNKLENIGQKMYKFTFEETIKEVATKPISMEESLKQLEQLLKNEKSAS